MVFGTFPQVPAIFGQSSCLTGIGYVKVGGTQNLAKTMKINSPPPSIANSFYSFDFYTFPQHLWESKGKIRKSSTNTSSISRKQFVVTTSHNRWYRCHFLFKNTPQVPAIFGQSSCLTGIGSVKVGGTQNLAKTMKINSPPPTIANSFYSFVIYTFRGNNSLPLPATTGGIGAISYGKTHGF